MNELAAARFQDHLEVFAETMESLSENDVLGHIALRCREALRSGKKILFCGNGGSAADAQHLAAELVGRYEKNRKALPAIALTTDTSVLTAVGNDFGFDEVYARQVEALGNMGDVIIAISTSGNSNNVVRAVEAARAKGMHTIAFTGASGGKLKEICDLIYAVPSDITARIQEMHILGGHIICELVECDYDDTANN